jgi:hypothetical protein
MMLFAVVVVMVSFTVRGFAVDDPCQTLWNVKGAGRIDSVSLVPQNGGLPEYCQVIGTLRSEIGYEVRLPTTEWNQKFYMAGCGGFWKKRGSDLFFKTDTEYGLERANI